MQQVSEFAEAELGALALIGGSAQNTGLPMTDNQRNKLLHQKEAAKKRLALKATKATPAWDAAAQQKPNPVVSRISATTSYGDPPCIHWVNKGRCLRGADCTFQHPGFDTTEERCVICGEKSHKSNVCTVLAEEQTLIGMKSGTDIAYVKKKPNQLGREHTHPHKERVKARVVDVAKADAREEKAKASIKVVVMPGLLSMGKPRGYRP